MITLVEQGSSPIGSAYRMLRDNEVSASDVVLFPDVPNVLEITGWLEKRFPGRVLDQKYTPWNSPGWFVANHPIIERVDSKGQLLVMLEEHGTILLSCVDTVDSLLSDMKFCDSSGNEAIRVFCNGVVVYPPVYAANIYLYRVTFDPGKVRSILKRRATAKNRKPKKPRPKLSTVHICRYIQALISMFWRQMHLDALMGTLGYWPSTSAWPVAGESLSRTMDFCRKNGIDLSCAKFKRKLAAQGGKMYWDHAPELLLDAVNKLKKRLIAVEAGCWEARSITERIKYFTLMRKQLLALGYGGKKDESSRKKRSRTQKA